MTYSVPSTERLLNAKHFSRLPPKSVARQEALWQDTLREGSVRALCQHLKEAVRARNSIDELLVFRGSLCALIQTQEGCRSPGDAYSTALSKTRLSLEAKSDWGNP